MSHGGYIIWIILTAVITILILAAGTLIAAELLPLPERGTRAKDGQTPPPDHAHRAGLQHSAARPAPSTAPIGQGRRILDATDAGSTRRPMPRRLSK